MLQTIILFMLVIIVYGVENRAIYYVSNTGESCTECCKTMICVPDAGVADDGELTETEMKRIATELVPTIHVYEVAHRYGYNKTYAPYILESNTSTTLVYHNNHKDGTTNNCGRSY